METSKTDYRDDWEPVITEPGMPLKLVAWRQTLSEKAKQEKKYRFYSLYSLVTHSDTISARAIGTGRDTIHTRAPERREERNL